MIKSTSTQPEEIYKYFLDNLRSKFSTNITHAILFGSRAKGIAKPWSDYDFVIVLNKKSRDIINEIYDVVTDALLKYGVDISLKIYSENDFQEKKLKKHPFINRIIESGIELWK